MSARKWLFIFSAIVIIAIILLVMAKPWTEKLIYFKNANEVLQKTDRLTKDKYQKEYNYTINKFWKLYKKGYLTRNDLNEVVWHMRKLKGQKEITDKEIFNLIGFISRMYIDALDKKDKERLSGER